jgi:predicted nucleic acid-binding protein
VRHVVVDANVFVSFFIDRDETQRLAARQLLQHADDGEIVAVVPQSVVFEVAYVLQSQYGVTGERLAAIVHAVVTFPGVQIVDDCPWNEIFELWPNRIAGLADASLTAIAIAYRHDAIATFDQKLAKRAKTLGVAMYW